MTLPVYADIQFLGVYFTCLHVVGLSELFSISPQGVQVSW